MNPVTYSGTPPQSFFDSLNDCASGNTFTISDQQLESEEYSKGYIDGMKQERKEQKEL